MKNPILILENLSLHNILHNINYTINDSDFIILLGSNGAGKSSLLKLLDQRYTPTSGKITLENKSITKYSEKDFSKTIITLTQNPQDSLFCSLTVLENCALASKRQQNCLSIRNFFKSVRLGIYRNGRGCRTASPSTGTYFPVQVNTQPGAKKLRILPNNKNRDFFRNYLMEFNKNLSTKLDVMANSLSGGEQQTLALALSVLHPPKILLLDEHTSALDPKTAANLLDITNRVVKKHKITCILSTHNLETAVNFGNRILALSNGKIFKCFEYEEKEKLTTTDLLKICYQ